MQRDPDSQKFDLKERNFAKPNRNFQISGRAIRADRYDIVCGIGTIIATFTRSQQQAQLLGFFVTPPLSMLSGATTPIEAIPHWLQPVTYLNPVRHFASLSRGVMLKGVGLDVVYPNLWL